MKIMVVNMNNGKDMDITLMADSTLLRSGQPFFIPNFAPHFAAVPMLMLRVGRLGKCIAKRFAHRYIDAMTASFIIKPLGDDLQPMTLNGMEHIMDGATIYGSWIDCDVSQPLSSINWTVAQSEGTIAHQDIAPAIDSAIEFLSQSTTLKMGDVVCLGLPETKPQLLHIDDIVTASVDGKLILKNKIK